MSMGRLGMVNLTLAFAAQQRLRWPGAPGRLDLIGRARQHLQLGVVCVDLLHTGQNRLAGHPGLENLLRKAPLVSQQ